MLTKISDNLRIDLENIACIESYDKVNEFTFAVGDLELYRRYRITDKRGIQFSIDKSEYNKLIELIDSNHVNNQQRAQQLQSELDNK